MTDKEKAFDAELHTLVQRYVADLEVDPFIMAEALLRSSQMTAFIGADQRRREGREEKAND